MVRLKMIGLRGHPSVLDARKDRNVSSESGRCTDLGRGTSVGIGDHVNEKLRDTHVGQGGGDSGMWYAPKSISEVKPSNKHILLVPTSISDDGLEKKGMLVATLRWTGTFLLVGKKVVVDGPGS